MCCCLAEPEKYAELVDEHDDLMQREKLANGGMDSHEKDLSVAEKN